AVLVTIVLAQTGSVRIITRPRVPSTENLDRLNMALNWYVRVPLDGPLDGIGTVQVLPRGLGERMTTEVFVQTLAGTAYLFDAETGTLRWKTPVGSLLYQGVLPAAANEQSIIVNRREFFYVLNRETGIQRVYKRIEGVKKYGYRMESVPTAGPAADDDIVAFSLRDRVVAYALPDFDKIAAMRDKPAALIEQLKEGSVQPLEAWKYYDPSLQLLSSPVLGTDRAGLIAEDGRFLSVDRENGLSKFTFKVGNPTTPLVSAGNVALVGSQDYFVYAFDMYRGALMWRFAAGAPVVQPMTLNEVDLFVRAENRGLFRVDKYYGQSYWMAPDAVKFLAVHYLRDRNGKFVLDRQGKVLAKYVYATDSQERLLILDGDRGSVLARFDTSLWKLPTTNGWTDRVYLANGDGQLVCLRPRDSRHPQFVRVNLPPPSKVPAGPPPEKKLDTDMEKKDPDKMEKKDAEKKAARIAPRVTPALTALERSLRDDARMTKE
ncbi:MAG TPA: PQQ-binding-like beta-propeller repeat protein, partial [Gemmataceae bacterium]|nr:PQQ-binding-like beta-propeller repeat protein [Gemmataceae bacterium]